MSDKRTVEEIDRLRVSELQAQMAAVQNALVALRINSERFQTQIQLSETQAQLQHVEEQRLQANLNKLMTELREKYDFSLDMTIDSRTGEIISAGQAQKQMPVQVPEPE